MPVEYICLVCGVTFYRSPSRIRTYCSNECAHTPPPLEPGPDGTMLVPSNSGRFAIIDEDDAHIVDPYRWCCDSLGYFRRKRRAGEGKGFSSVLMHREILNAPAGVDVDHINGDPSDNRRANLRVATRSQNRVNTGLQSNNTSGYKGVSWRVKHQKWQAAISRIEPRGMRFLGHFDSAIEAARAYDAAAIELYGEFARLNFPDEWPERP